MISGTIKFGEGGAGRNVGNANDGTGFLEHRAKAFNRIIDNNTAKLNALMDAMNGVKTPPADGGEDGDTTSGDTTGGDTGIEGNDQYLMAAWSQVNGQLNLAISLEGKDTQSAYETAKGLIQNAAG